MVQKTSNKTTLQMEVSRHWPESLGYEYRDSSLIGAIGQIALAGDMIIVTAGVAKGGDHAGLCERMQDQGVPIERRFFAPVALEGVGVRHFAIGSWHEDGNTGGYCLADKAETEAAGEVSGDHERVARLAFYALKSVTPHAPTIDDQAIYAWTKQQLDSLFL